VKLLIIMVMINVGETKKNHIFSTAIKAICTARILNTQCFLTIPSSTLSRLACGQYFE
jgi:hypothetical protein